MGTSCNNYLGGTRNRMVILSVPIGAEVHLEWLFYHFPEVLWSSKVKHLMCRLYAIFLLQNNFSLSFINDISRWTYFIPFPKCIHLYWRQEKILLSKGLKHSAPLTLFFNYFFILFMLDCTVKMEQPSLELEYDPAICWRQISMNSASHAALSYQLLKFLDN